MAKNENASVGTGKGKSRPPGDGSGTKSAKVSSAHSSAQPSAQSPAQSPAKPSAQSLAKSPAAEGTPRKAALANTRSLEKRLADLRLLLADVVDLNAASAVLGWDQATYMPKGGGAARGRQCATLNRIAHEKFTDPAVGRLLDQVQAAVSERAPDSDDAALVRVTRRDYERAIKVPPALVERMAEHSNRAYTAWTVARPANDFAAVAPLLETGVELARELAEKLGGGTHIMDALVEGAEPGMTVADVRVLFDALRPALVDLVAKATAGKCGDDACLRQHYPEAKQIALGLKIAERFGFDLTRGRLDQSPHPFCTTFAVGDVRITTRVKANDLGDALFSTLHEAGHAMYEQGVAADLDRTPLAGGTSAGVHESQSRLWENIVGRSEAFLKYAYPLLQRQFTEQLRHVTDKAFYRAINLVQPSLIRTDADELTYNLHIMIRFDLECALLEDRLKISELPDAWNARYAADLGITPPSDSDGCLQDVHWFGGVVGGAFQSYTIGNILSAQFYAAALAKHPEITSEISAGKFSTLHTWLADNIYRHGRKYDPSELVMRATGKPMTTKPYLDYLTHKYGALNSGAA